MTAAIPISPDELRLQAASLAFALLRFGAGAAHPDISTPPPGVPNTGTLKTGTECYLFTPSWRRIPIAGVARFLAELPSAALLTSTTTRGIATLTLLDELTGDRREWAEKTLSNQQAGLEHMVAQLSLNENARIVLQFDEEEHWYSLAVLRAWCAGYGVDVPWNMRAYEDDSRAQARLMLYRSDGATSWGESCPVRRR